MENEITDKNFWSKYWKDKNPIKKVSENYPFSDLFKKYIPRNSKTIIEIGGFPGHFAIYFKKYLSLTPTILDYHKDKGVLKKLLKTNNIRSGIEVINEDFLKWRTKRKFDVVYSLGFIEHFTNYGEIIEKHWDLTKKGGTMLIVLPNFLGLNGILQLLVDPENLNKHNLESMVINNLEEKASQLDTKHVEVFYWGGLGVWLEGLNSRSIFLKILIYGLSALGLVWKKTGIESKLLSPYIVIYAKK